MKYVEYRCDSCDFITKNKSHYTFHCESSKHIKNIDIEINTKLSKNNHEIIQQLDSDVEIENLNIVIQNNNFHEYRCEYCNNKFTRLSNLTRHKKVCTEEKIHKNDLLLKLRYEQELHQKDIELHKKDFEKYELCKKEMEYYKDIINMAGGMVQKTVSALTYIVNTYDGAPVIKKITFEDVQKSVKIDDEKIISKIFYHYNRNKLGQYIGDIIVENYKKKDPSEQSIWNTDTSRLTYLLKKILLDDNSKWMVDKKGLDTIDYLITPIIDRVREMAIEYQEINCFGNDLDSSKVMLINDIYSRLMIDIDNKKIHNDILKYIAPHFYLNANRIIEDD